MQGMRNYKSHFLKMQKEGKGDIRRESASDSDGEEAVDLHVHVFLLRFILKATLMSHCRNRLL